MNIYYYSKEMYIIGVSWRTMGQNSYQIPNYIDHRSLEKSMTYKLNPSQPILYLVLSLIQLYYYDKIKYPHFYKTLICKLPRIKD